MSNLTDLYLQTYKENNENYYSSGRYKNTRNNFKVHDVIKISDTLSHDNGYEGNIGIVTSLSGIDEYVYVIAYNSKDKRYWVCGFTESDLSKLPINLELVNLQLKEAYINYIKRNCFQFVNKNFKKQLENLKYNESRNNVIYVDFKN